MIFGALQVTKVLSKEVKRAIEGPGKDFGKSKLKSLVLSLGSTLCEDESRELGLRFCRKM